MSDDKEKKLAKVIEFPYHKLKSSSMASEEKYANALDRFELWKDVINHRMVCR